MKCPKCQSNLIIGLPYCVSCHQSLKSSEPIQCKKFIFTTAIIFCLLGIYGPFDGFVGFLKIIWFGTWSGVVWGSIIWLFYMLFRINRH